MSDTIKFERGIGFYIEEDNSEECFDDEDFMEEYYDNMPQEEKYEKTYDDIDAHNCKDHVDVLGYCQFCGAVVYGTMAYEELYGGE